MVDVASIQAAFQSYNFGSVNKYPWFFLNIMQGKLMSWAQPVQRSPLPQEKSRRGMSVHRLRPVWYNISEKHYNHQLNKSLSYSDPEGTLEKSKTLIQQQ